MDTSLRNYNQKRNFSYTMEPKGNIKKSEETLKFVVQHHIAKRDHYDFRLEWNGVLLSWAVPKGPSYNARDKRLAVKVENHPLEYSNFEGTIPKGEYGGGTVMLWDEGTWEPHANVDEELNNGSLKFSLNGRRLKGSWTLVRIEAKAGDNKDNWLLIKEKDVYTESFDNITEHKTSIRTGRTMSEIESGEETKITRNPFSQIDVQLARLVNAIPEEEDWLYEMKYDGYRIIAFLEGSSVRLITRNNNDYTDRFASIANTLLDWSAGRSMVLDGEMVIVDETGKTDFGALQDYMKNPRTRNLTYIVFDLLALNGTDIRGQCLSKRKAALLDLMTDLPNNLQYSKHVHGNGKECFRAACDLGMEGIIGKKAGSIYSGNRNGDWVKLKCKKTQEFVIGGYSLTNKKTSGISSLLLGVYDDNELVYIGRVGTGMNVADEKNLEFKFKGIMRSQSPFILAPGNKANEKITWLEPMLIAEIKFAGWTKDNILRHASYKGLRADINPKDIKMEKKDELKKTEELKKPAELERPMEQNSNSILIKGIKITNPDKIIFDTPVVTKIELIRFYEKVSKRMLPFVRRRILSVVRCPNGISQSCFFKKHPDSDKKGIISIPILTDEKSDEYFYIENEYGILSEAQMGTLEFHIGGSRTDELERPDMMVFDLDPDEGMNLDIVRQGVKDLKTILTGLSLNSYLKTSGGKGYHVVIPLKPGASWNTFHDFARRVAEVMEMKWPERYTSNVRKSSRINKIFIDWIRNGRGTTSISPYSIRARKGAPVSMPIAWSELDRIAPDGINMSEALIRIGGNDPWEDYFLNEQMLK